MEKPGQTLGLTVSTNFLIVFVFTHALLMKSRTLPGALGEKGGEYVFASVSQHQHFLF